MNCVVRIDSMIIFCPSKLWKAKFFILCDVIIISGEAAGEIWNCYKIVLKSYLQSE